MLGAFLGLLLIAAISPAALGAENADRCEIKKKPKKPKRTRPPEQTKSKDPKVEERRKELARLAEERRIENRKKGLEFMIGQLRYGVSANRRQAIGRIPALDDDEKAQVLPILLKLAKSDSDSLVRESALRMIGHLKHKPGVPILEVALDDTDKDLVRAAVASLGRIKAASAAPKILTLLKKSKLDEQNELDELLIRTLGQLEYGEAGAYLLGKAEEKETAHQVVENILLFLGEVKYQPARSFLLKKAEDKDAGVLIRAYSVNAIGRLGNKADAPALQKILKEIAAIRKSDERAKLSGLRLHLIAALIRLGDKSVEKEIVAAARDDDAFVRSRAVKQLGELKLASARPLLCFRYLHDPSKGVRRAARRAIMAIDGEK